MRLSALFTDHGVLQRDCAIPVWGWSRPGEKITVELAGKTAKATADASGCWRTELPALPAGGPFEMVVQSAPATPNATIALPLRVKDLMIGEVWVCSGQSNMEWPLEMSTDSAQALAGAEQPQIRLFTVPKRTEIAPLAEVEAQWARCSAASAAGFSAVAYFFGHELQGKLGVAIGLINTSWGGTPAQAWTSRPGLQAEPALKGYLDELRLLELPPEEVRARNAAQRAEFLAKLPQDAGNKGFAEGWAGLEFNDTDWRTMAVPNYWINVGHATNGVFWFRRTVEVPAAWAGQAVRLSLGAVDKSDDSYVNGQRVGGLNWAKEPQSWSTPRNYTVPAGVLKAGKNVIAVRAVSNYTGGGMTGAGSSMELHPPAGSGDEAIALSGPWKYAIEQDFGRVTGINEPVTLMGANTPTMLYNGMIAPLIPFAIRGAIWYQGESNAADAARYRTLFPAMIRDWRKQWARGDFPFYFVQLANYIHQPKTLESDDSRWAELREAQDQALKLPNTGVAVAIDIGEPKDIHPRNKKDVGLRLAFNALAQIHGQAVVYRGPRFKAVKVEGGTARVQLDAAEGLRARGAVVKGFGVAGADQVFHAAVARIEGGVVVVSSSKVAAPVAVRYGWADFPECTLENGAGLPAEPFRSDDWPVGPKVRAK